MSLNLIYVLFLFQIEAKVGRQPFHNNPGQYGGVHEGCRSCFPGGWTKSVSFAVLQSFSRCLILILCTSLLLPSLIIAHDRLSFLKYCLLEVQICIPWQRAGDWRSGVLRTSALFLSQKLHMESSLLGIHMSHWRYWRFPLNSCMMRVISLHYFVWPLKSAKKYQLRELAKNDTIYHHFCCIIGVTLYTKRIHSPSHMQIFMRPLFICFAQLITCQRNL